jgi:metal-sulfur cluster biosynthetic enzyme
MAPRGADPGLPSVAAVRERLDRVTDPELDESIVDLDYVDEIGIDPLSDRDVARVTVRFTLPTAWCSPAFAWMMATDAREEVEALPGVATARVRLRDHMHAAEINHGVNERLDFADVFPDADGGVREVRATLDDKARLTRQHDAVDALLDAGLTPDQIVALDRGDIAFEEGGDERTDDRAERAHVYVRGRTVGVSVPAAPLRSYLRKARATGHVAGPDDRLFYTPEGEPIPVDRFDLIRKRTRLAQVNMGGQGSVCEALNDARRDPPERLGPDASGEAD